jgi:hypothetical protein
MAYQFTAASSQYLSTVSAPSTPSPMTLACWARPTNLAATRAALSVGSSQGDYNERIQLVVTATGIVRATQVVVSTVVQSDTTQTLSVNAWGHIAGVFETQSSRTAYLHGVAATTNTSAIDNHRPAEFILVGARWDSNSLGNYFNGQLAEVGVWSAALTAAEIASLAKGMTCDKVRPQSLVFYAPLVRNLQDVRGGLTITNNNGATVANHPRVYA